MPNVLPLARTNAEARLFLDLQPCPGCGRGKCVFRSSVITVDGALASRYTGDCAQCGEHRVYEFLLPDEVLPPPAGSVRFGADDPSKLLDPGVWLWYSDMCAQRVPSDTTGLDEQGLRVARHTLATALAAIEEVLKFVPATADSIPASAFVSQDGRAVYQREPGRFSRARLQAVRDHYAERLAAW